jgi:hypothetical protein
MKRCTLCSSIGLPATQRNCFSSDPPVRVPCPPATITTPTSRTTSLAGRASAPGRLVIAGGGTTWRGV